MVFYGKRFTIIIVCHFFKGIFNADHTDVMNIYNTLLYNGSDGAYNTDIRPSYLMNPGAKTSLNIELKLMSINDLDDISGTFSTVISLKISWNDARMEWDPLLYNNVNEILIHQDKVWTPPITVNNPVNKVLKLEVADNMVRYDANGNAVQIIREFLQTSCNVDSTNFPFDRQTCNIILIAGLYNGTDLEFETFSIDMSLYSENGLWELSSTSVSTGLVDREYPVVRYTINLKRRYGFFIVHIFIPVTILVLLNSVVFVLPTDSGERTGYSITCLLALAVYLTLTSDLIPKSSKPLSILSCFLTILVCISSVICLLTITSVCLHHKDDPEPVPKYLKNITRCMLRRKICNTKRNKGFTSVKIFKTKHTESVELDHQKPSTMSTKRGSSIVQLKQDLKISRISSQISDKQIKEIKKPVSKEKNGDEHRDDITWKDISRLFDWMSFVFTICLTAIVGFLYVLIAGGNFF